MELTGRLAEEGRQGTCIGRSLIFAQFRLDAAEEQLWRGERLIALQPKTFRVLLYLVERPQRLVSKQELLRSIWSDALVGAAVLKSQVREIRRLLGDTSRTPRFIETVHRRGYRFVAPVEEQPAVVGQPTVSAPMEAQPASACQRSSAPVPVLVGRRLELELLRARWDESSRGSRRVLMLTGDPGIGKTTLVNAFLDELRMSSDACVARAQCIEQYGAGEPYLPFLEALAQVCQATGSAAVELLTRSAPDWLLQMPEFFEPARAPGQSSARPPVTAERMLREMGDAIPRLSELRPLVLVLEDLHWADPSTLALLSYLAQRADRARLLLIGTYRARDVRSSEHPLWEIQQLLEARAQAEEIALPGLAHSEVDAYLDLRFPARQFPAELGRAVVEVTGGNPLFLVRALDALVKRGLVFERAGTWRWRGELSQLFSVVPENLVLLIAGETERLTELERRVLEAAAVAGVEFTASAVAAALDQDPLDVEELCIRWARQGRFVKLAARAELVELEGAESTGTPLRCAFVHTLYRQVLYQRLAPARRRQLHFGLGLYEESRHTSNPRGVAGMLALHFGGGGDAQRVVRYAYLAGLQALGRSAYREAIGHFEIALDTLKRTGDDDARARLELQLVALGVPWKMVRGYSAPEVEGVYQRAADLCEQLGDTSQSLQVLGGLSRLYFIRGRVTSARQMALRFLRVAEPSEDPMIRFDARLALAVASYHLGDLADAETQLSSALARYPAALRGTRASFYHPCPYLAAQCYLAQLLWLRGHVDQAVARCEAALALAQDVGDSGGIVCVLHHASLIDKYCGLPNLGERADAYAAFCAEHSFAFYGLLARGLQAVAAVRNGDASQGLRQLRSTWERLRAEGGEIGAPCWYWELAEAALACGEIETALGDLRAGFAALQLGGERFWEPELYRLYGEACLRAPGEPQPLLGDEEPELTPERAFSRALDLAQRSGARMLELRAATSLARLWTKQQRPSEARALLAGVYSSFAEGHSTADLRRAREALSELDG